LCAKRSTPRRVSEAANTALRLSRYLGTSERFWLNLPARTARLEGLRVAERPADAARKRLAARALLAPLNSPTGGYFFDGERNVGDRRPLTARAWRGREAGPGRARATPARRPRRAPPARTHPARARAPRWRALQGLRASRTAHRGGRRAAASCSGRSVRSRGERISTIRVGAPSMPRRLIRPSRAVSR
jgi:hypothetical protein